MPSLTALKAYVAEHPRHAEVIKQLIRYYDADNFNDAREAVMSIFNWAVSPQGNRYWDRRHSGLDPITPADIVWLNQLVPDYERIQKIEYFHEYRGNLAVLRDHVTKDNVNLFDFNDASAAWGIPRGEFSTTIGNSSARVLRCVWELLNIHERQTPRTKVTPIPEHILAVPLVRRAPVDPNDKGANHPNYRPGAKPESGSFGNACCASTVYSWGGSASEASRKFVIGDAEMRKYHTFLDTQRRYSTMLLQKSQFKQYEHLIAGLGWSRTTKWMDGNNDEPVAFFVRCNRDTTKKAAINGQHNCTDSDDT